MAYLHPNERLNVSTLDGWSDFILLEPLPFRLLDGRLLRGRAGATTDGLSSPKWVKCDLQTTNSFFPTVSHDNFYRGDIEESFDDGATWQPWEPWQYDKSYADAALAELAEANFVPIQEIALLKTAVVDFGQTAWDNDAKLRNTKKTELPATA